MKIIKWILASIFVLLLVSMFLSYILRGESGLKLLTLYMNISSKHTTEYHDFVLNLPKTRWFTLADFHINMFAVDENNESFAITRVDSDNRLPIFYIIDNIMCEKPIKRTKETMYNGWTATVYDCIYNSKDSNKSDLAKIYAYKNSGFMLYPYDEKWQSYYDEFFRYVKVKENDKTKK